MKVTNRLRSLDVRTAGLPGCRAAGLFAALLVVPPAPALGQAASQLSSSVREYVSVAEPVVALTGVTVIDGTGAPARRDQTIVIRDGRIAAVGARGSVDVPRGARVLDRRGQIVIPGFVGMHNHTFYTTSSRQAQLNFSAPRLYLASGVTTIRTTGSYSPYSELNMKRDIEAGRAPGPRMYVTGPYITGAGTGGNMHRLSGPEDARRVVSYWAEEGASWFKAYTQISREELAAAIDEAHKHGIKVTGHLCSVSFTEAVELGIDNIEHGFLTNSDYDPRKRPDACPTTMRQSQQAVDIDGPEVGRTISTMIDNGVAMTSTLAVYELFVPRRLQVEDRVLEAMAPEIRREYLTTREQIDLTESPLTDLFAKSMEFERRFVREGGVLGAGVDPTGNGGALPGFGDQRNYELLREAGFTPEETVQIMSANGARILGTFEDYGSIEVGKRADLIVIDGDILGSPETIRNVTLVFKDGVGYDSAKLIDSVRGQVGVR